MAVEFKLFSFQHSCLHIGEVETATGHMFNSKQRIEYLALQTDSILIAKPKQ